MPKHRRRRATQDRGSAAGRSPGFDSFTASQLAGRLIIELTEPTRRIGPGSANVRAPSTARITSLGLELEVFEEAAFRKLTQEERDRVVIREPLIRLSGLAGQVVEHRAPNGATFTLQDPWNAVEETERRTRGQTAWFGGIDVDHVFFEGLPAEEGGIWAIHWGS